MLHGLAVPQPKRLVFAAHGHLDRVARNLAVLKYAVYESACAGKTQLGAVLFLGQYSTIDAGRMLHYLHFRSRRRSKALAPVEGGVGWANNDFVFVASQARRLGTALPIEPVSPGRSPRDGPDWNRVGQ